MPFFGEAMTALTDALSALQADVTQVGKLTTASNSATIKAAQAKLKTDVAALATAVNPTPPPPPPPANQVTNLTAKATAQGELTLDGTPPSPAPSGYTIGRDGTDTTGAGPWSGDVTSGPPWKFDKLLDATTYHLTVTPKGGAAATVAGTTSGSTPPPPPPPSGGDPTPTMRLVWPSTPGVVPPSSLVNYDRLGGGGFGNGELETYTNSPANGYLDGKGNFVIVAKADKTSCRVNLIPWGYVQPGSYVEVPAILPPNGWAAIWTIGKNAVSGTPWPTCGEGDIVEISGGHALGNVHVGDSGGGDQESGWGYPGCDAGPVDGKTWDKWGMYFDGSVVKYYRNRKQFMQWTAAQAAAKGCNSWPFNQPHYLILNVAIAGGDNGFTGATATFGPINVWPISAAPALS